MIKHKKALIIKNLVFKTFLKTEKHKYIIIKMLIITHDTVT